jgi:Zn-dependent alcohol dehydrogenase
VQGARIAGGLPIIAVDPVPLKRETALQLGATHAVDPTAEDALERIRELTGGRGVDVALETAGRNETATAALLSTRKGGTTMCVGGGIPDVSSMTTLEAKSVRWTLYGNADPRRDFPKLVAMAEQGLLDVEHMVSRRLTLDEVNDGFDAMERGEVIRAVVLL